jgi:hypothetical protein
MRARFSTSLSAASISSAEVVALDVEDADGRHEVGSGLGVRAALTEEVADGGDEAGAGAHLPPSACLLASLW